MQGTTFQKVCGLVRQKVHFAPWQVSQATFGDGLLKPLETNGCIYQHVICGLDDLVDTKVAIIVNSSTLSNI